MRLEVCLCPCHRGPEGFGLFEGLRTNGNPQAGVETAGCDPIDQSDRAAHRGAFQRVILDRKQSDKNGGRKIVARGLDNHRRERIVL